MAAQHNETQDQPTIEEAGRVETDQHALVRKVLARYSTDFAMFRELLQNADDAESKAVTICFESDSNQNSSDIIKWTFTNNGKTFKEHDWDRLKKIASGNTDPKKVGAFGVGFYTVFSVTDHPVVSSGGCKMKFFWEGGNGPLCFHKSSCSTNETGAVIEIPLRKPLRMQKVNDLLKFLATSITFMEKLEDVQVLLDKKLLGGIKKSEQTSAEIKLPITPKHANTLKTMTATPSELKLSPITIRYVDSAHREMELKLKIFTIVANIGMDQEFSEELAFRMLKEQDRLIEYRLIYTGKVEYDQSSMDREHKSIFQGLRADLDGHVVSASHPTIFIGHATQQTTGIGGQMASQFIPTIERDSIDLCNPYIAEWNNELLYLGGFLSRSIYEQELTDIQTAWENSKASDFTWLHKRFMHVLEFFTIHPTTPSTKVGEKLRESFYTCTGSPLRLLSSVGVRNISDIRLFDPLCEKFLKDVPMLSSDLNDSVVDFINLHPDKPEIQAVTPSDVERDLRSHILDGSNGELVAFLQWILRKWTAGATYRDLKDVARFRDAGENEIPLSSIQHFINPKGHGRHIPQKGPLPLTVIPRQITEISRTAAHWQQFSNFSWKEFTVVDWIHHISDGNVTANSEYNFAQSAEWAECVLHSVSSAWSSGGDVHEVAKSVFSRETCIPTTLGLCIPDQSCLPGSNVTKFDFKFPIVKFPSSCEISGEMEQFLVALGVRKHPPFRLFLDQKLLKTSDLVNHLAQVDATTGLSSQEIEDLRSSPVFSRKSTQGHSEPGFRIHQLYPTIEIFRQLGLPLIDWGGSEEWDESRAEVKLLYRLGLLRSPPLKEILILCSRDTEARGSAFEYFCENVTVQSEYLNYNPCLEEFQSIAFVPAEITGHKDGLRKPTEVFFDQKWKPCGFPVVRSGCQESILEELGIQRHPPSSLILQKLKELEKDQNCGEETARELLPILCGHVSSFEKNQLEAISLLHIVPATTPEGRKMVTPIECYLEKRTKHDLYSQLFNFVDFSNGEIFLRACGAKNEPTEEDVAIRLISDPKNFYDIANRLKPEGRFLQELLDLASRTTRISNGTMTKMKTHSVLLGDRPNAEYENWPLWKPGEIFIVDNAHTFDLFKFRKDSKIVSAPRNMARELEEFYLSLGCQPITTAIRDQIHPGAEIKNTEMASQYRDFVLGRLPLFLQSYPHRRPDTSSSCFDGAIDMTVRFWKKLSVSKTLTVSRNNFKETTPEQPVFATATYKREDKRIELWLTYEMKNDVHDLALSLCKVFLGTENRPDVEFLTTCLSVEPSVLKKRWYQSHVNEKSQSEQCLNDWKFAQTLIDTIPSESASIPVVDLTAQLSAAEMEHDSAIVPPGKRTINQSHLLGSNQPASSSRTSFSAPSRRARKVLSSLRSGLFQVGTTAVIRRQSPDQVMPRKHIKSTVEAAIQASKPGQQVPRLCNDDPTMDKFIKSGYCDVTNLQFFHQSKIQDVEVYVAPDSDVNTDTMSLIESFLEIIKPIATIYNLTTESFRAFYPTTAGSIAFNREGTLYLNLRYFEEWHYEDVRNNKRRKALTLWFLTFAHEIAHNLVEGHDAEHEFWFLAICEESMDKLSHLLGSASV